MKNKINIRGTVNIVCGVNIVLIISVLAMAISLLASHELDLDRGEQLLVVLLSIMAVLCSLVTILLAWTLREKENELVQIRSSLVDMNRLNNAIRAQRHDYLNHLQVVFGLMELEQYQDAHDYIERVYSDIQKISSVLKTSIPALNAILQAKMQMCERRSIALRFEITTSFEDAVMPDWEICRLFGNIIDNAINALDEQEGEKTMTVRLFEDIRSLGFSISNNGPEIPKGVIDKIFEPGFSAGKHKGEGMGLAICRRLMQKHGGELDVISNETATTFIGIIPRKQPG